MSSNPKTNSAKSFRATVARGVSWSTVANVTTQATNFITFAILGKFFLTPADFGLVAMITVITGFAALFTQFGLGAALIQKQQINESHKSSVFWLTLATATVLATGITLSRSAIGGFYEQPALVPMVAPLAATLVLAACSSVPMTLLRKTLAFKELSLVSITADLAAMFTAISSAAYGLGAWALVVKVLSLRIVFLLGIWIVCKWRPRLLFCVDSVKEVLGFGASFFSTSMLIYVAGKVSELVVGKFAGDAALGLYSNACKMVVAPIGLIKNQVVGVFFPAFSSIQDDLERTKKLTLKLSALLALIGFPALFFVIVAASSLVDCFLSPQWSGMKLMMVLLSAAAMFEISIFPGVIFLSQGKPGKYFKLMLFTKAISVAGIAFGVMAAGVPGMLAGMLIAAVINFLPYVIFSGRVIKLNMLQQLQVNFMPFVLSAVTATVAFTADYFIFTEQSPLIRVLAITTLFFLATASQYFLIRPFPLESEIARWRRAGTSRT